MRKVTIMAMIAVACAAGCATAPAPLTLRNDKRTATEHSPYRSIPAAIQCDGCGL